MLCMSRYHGGHSITAVPEENRERVMRVICAYRYSWELEDFLFMHVGHEIILWVIFCVRIRARCLFIDRRNGVFDAVIPDMSRFLSRIDNAQQLRLNIRLWAHFCVLYNKGGNLPSKVGVHILCFKYQMIWIKKY